MSNCVQGYAEGYYGRLLSWDERLAVLDTLSEIGQNTYYYAPKEDARHRWHWRTPYDSDWRNSFAQFCQQAKSRNIAVVAGVAPGLDFDFNDLPSGPDFNRLLEKCQQLISDGADHVSLLMDDIDADFHRRSAGMKSEGQAHAQLANSLSDALAKPLWVTPRIYANELVKGAPEYLLDFLGTLNREHKFLYCGSDVVARNASIESLAEVTSLTPHEQVLWDNLYANDYCPRRLFIGPWTGRDSSSSVLLNPTGLVHTDCLLLDVMAHCQSATDTFAGWQAVLTRHGVPESFFAIADFFWHPVFNDRQDQPGLIINASMLDAIEECLWRWKTPLSREWYPYIFGLKHDLAAYNNTLPALRILKTQTRALAERLLNHST